MFEVIAIWEGEFFMHQTLDEQEALEWAKQYRDNKDCSTRVWRVL